MYTIHPVLRASCGLVDKADKQINFEHVLSIRELEFIPHKNLDYIKLDLLRIQAELMFNVPYVKKFLPSYYSLGYLLNPLWNE